MPKVDLGIPFVSHNWAVCILIALKVLDIALYMYWSHTDMQLSQYLWVVGNDKRKT